MNNIPGSWGHWEPFLGDHKHKQGVLLLLGFTSDCKVSRNKWMQKLYKVNDIERFRYCISMFKGVVALFMFYKEEVGDVAMSDDIVWLC